MGRRTIVITDTNADRELSRLRVGEPVRLETSFLTGTYTVEHAGLMRVPTEPAYADVAVGDGRTVRVHDELVRSSSVLGAALRTPSGRTRVVGAPALGPAFQLGGPRPQSRLWGSQYAPR